MDEQPPRKATVLIPPVEHPECVTRLLGWICYPSVDQYKQREKLAHNLVAWWWRNCREMALVPRSGVPQWVKNINQRSNFAGVDAIRPGLNKAKSCVWAWRLARNSKLGAYNRSVGLHQIFEARESNPEHFRDRSWAILRPLMHVAEHVLEALDHEIWRWEFRHRADSPQARALLGLISDSSWVPGRLSAAEKLRLGWNAELGAHVGLHPLKTYRVVIAENVHSLGGHGDFVTP